MKDIVKSLLTTVILFLTAATLQANTECATKRMSDIVKSLEKHGMEVNGQSYSQRVKALSPDVEVYVLCDSTGMVRHAGYKLPMLPALGDYGSIPELRFVARYLLELMLIEDDIDLNNEVKVNHVRIFSETATGSLRQIVRKSLEKMKPETSVLLNFQQGNYDVVFVQGGKKLLSVKFPARYDLIMGVTKPEAEEGIPYLLAQADTTSLNVNIPMEEDLIMTEDSLYVLDDNGWYLVDKIHSSSYYEKQGNNLSLVFGDKHRPESAYNLFNSGADFHLMAQLTQNMYKGKRTFDVSVIRLIQALRQQGCTIYTGIKNIDSKGVSGTVYAVNQSMGYQHHLSFTMPYDVLYSKTPHPVIIEMRSYVPIHNFIGTRK